MFHFGGGPEYSKESPSGTILLDFLSEEKIRFCPKILETVFTQCKMDF